MKNAQILESSEVHCALREYFTKRGYNVGAMVVYITAPLLVSGLTTLDGEAVDHEDEEYDEPNDEEVKTLLSNIRECIANEPATIAQIATKLDLPRSTVVNAFEAMSDVARVAPAREDGQTVPMFMISGTEAYDKFVEMERERIEAQVETWKSVVLQHVPRFYEEPETRPNIIEAMCEGRPEDVGEVLRRDGKAIFYRMAEMDLLHHSGNVWQAFRTELDEKNTEMLRNSIREVFEDVDLDDLSVEEIAAKLPASLDEGLLRYVLGR